MKLSELFDELPEDNEETQGLSVIVEDQDGNRYVIDYVEANWGTNEIIINVKF